MALTADRVTNVPVPFRQLRMKDAEGALQEGVVGAADLKVAQRGAGANMSVDIPVGACWVQIDTGTRNGLVHVYNDAVANVAFNASDATNPRIDQIGVQYNDTSIPAGTGGNTPTFRYLPGTATAGAQIINNGAAGYRAGAAAAPNDWMRLADILVPATSTSVTTANIVDRRPWARGAFWRNQRTAGDYTTIGTTPAALDTATWSARLECSGVPLKDNHSGTALHSVSQGTLSFRLLMDGAAAFDRTIEVSVAGGFEAVEINVPFVPSAGSHVFDWQWWTPSGGTATLKAGTSYIAYLSYREDVRPSANNT